MFDFNAERIEKLERRVALLEGKPDPGLPCRGTDESACENGNIKVYWEDSYNWDWKTCPQCNGTRRIYP